MKKASHRSRWIKALGLFVLLWAMAIPSYAADSLPDFTSLVEQYGPSVVNISTSRSAKAQAKEYQDDMPPEMQDMLRRFFGDDLPFSPYGPGPDEPEARSLGSGFIISHDGYIVTNNHVIRDADEITVRLSDGREIDAKLMGADEGSDLALLKIDAKDLPAVKFGSSEKLKVGEWVLAIGSPFGFDHSATAGIVSAKGRGLRTEKYVPFIQTDVAINPGNSGGPLFNLVGEVVGINSQIISRTGGYLGMSFAIPSDVAVNVIEQLKDSGYVQRGWLGVSFQNVNKDLAESFGLKSVTGALVAEVIADSPADKAGFKAGDVITRFAGETVLSASDLPHLVGKVKPNSKINVELIRNKKPMTLAVTILALPRDDEEKDKAAKTAPAEENRLGVQVRALTEEEQAKVGKDMVGLLVEDVERDSPAYEGGIHRGDLIVSIALQPMTSEKQFNKVVASLPKNSIVPVLVSRRGSALIYLAVKVG